MKLPGLKSRVSLGLPGFAGLPTLRSGRHSSPGLKAWGFLAGFINSNGNGEEARIVHKRLRLWCLILLNVTVIEC
jgi:hypothetical protein